MSNEEQNKNTVNSNQTIQEISDLDQNLLIKLLDSLIEEQNLIQVKE